MSGLILKLSPKERILINGAVVENGDRRARLSIRTPDANILRLRDAIHPDEVNTPVKRVCYALQLVLSGDTDPDSAHYHLARSIGELAQVFTNSEAKNQIEKAVSALSHGDHYRCLKALRTLLPIEEDWLATGA